MTDLLSFSDIAGNKIDLSSSENYKNHAFAEHSCVVHILKQFDTDFYWFLKENEDLNMIDLVQTSDCFLCLPHLFVKKYSL
ncbi:MAG: hypothetical protein CM15mV24_1200 [Bellamyvirus sp.]|nr:MAG: hypothetical protein CM15mV24_1200 [Bellamyvirus sp.]